MAKGDKTIVNVEYAVTADTKQIEAILKGISDNISASMGATLGNALTKATSTFTKNLGKNIQINFNDTILGTLKKPIVLDLDVKKAKDKIDSLVKPLQNIVGRLNQITSGGKVQLLKPQESRDLQDSLNILKKGLQNY